MERRIGARRPITWLHLNWRVRRGGWRSRLVEERVSALDVSTSGMGVIARTVPTMRRGDVVMLLLDGMRVPARVRRVVPSDIPEATAYGLEFMDAPPEFVRSLLVQSGEAPDGGLELTWRRAA